MSVLLSKTVSQQPKDKKSSGRHTSLIKLNALRKADEGRLKYWLIEVTLCFG